MAKEVINDHIINAPLNDLISERYGDYAKYIIQDRALPDARDGLKPVQRRILYAMYKDGNTNDKAFRKSAKTVGLVIGNYHPHGDSSVYEAMVRLSQQWKINYPLIQMHGNNGSIDDDPAAAMRYTEARLAQISNELLEDIDKNTITWTPNFDDTENEPTVLPAKFPNLLVNGSTGIAAGYATNIPPHNLGEVIDGTIYRINHPDCTLDDLMNFIKGPDFPTCGIVQGLKGIREAFETGRGRVVVRAKTEIVQTKTVQQIIVSEIPYEVIKCNIVKKIDDIRFSKEGDGILDCRDESDRNGLRIVIDVHKDLDANIILNYLFKNTDLQVYYNYNMIAIVNNRPMLLSLTAALDSYIQFMKQVVLSRSKFEFEKRIDRCHILEGLIKAVSVMDEIIKIIRNSKDKADAKARLIERFQFSEAQAEAIVVLRLYRLTNTDVFELKNEYQTLVDELKELKEIIDNPQKLAQTLCDELTETKEKYAHPRLSVIEEEVSDIAVDKISMIANERVVVVMSRDGYIKKVSMRSFNASEGQMPGLKDEDELLGYIECNTLDTIIAFTESGEYILLPVYELSESKFKDLGNHISNYVKVNNSEKFISAFIVTNFNSCAYIITASENGMVKKTLIEEFKMQRTGKSSLAMNLLEGDRVIFADVAYTGEEITLVSKEGYSMRYSIDQIPLVAARAKGVKSIRLVGDDKVADGAILHSSDSEIVYISDKGLSKRLKENELERTNRATKGVLIAKKNKANPAYIRYVIGCSLNDSLNLVEDKKWMNIAGKDINLLGCDSRFSSTSLSKNMYRCRQIKEIRIEEFPVEKHEKTFEEFTLEV